jgi:hypothetical protein
VIPVRLATHQWSTKIPLCEICEIICHSSNNSIKKIMPIGDTYLATRQLLHCKQRNIFIICKQFNIFVIIHVHSLHHYLQREEEMNLEILPLGELSKIQLEILLKKNPSLYYPRDTWDKWWGKISMQNISDFSTTKRNIWDSRPWKKII